MKSIKIEVGMRSLVVVFGLSGTGKSFVARILSEELGYRWLRSDVLRKELLGFAPEQDLSSEFGKGIYSEDITKKVYEELIRRAKQLLSEGHRVVIDATFLRKWQRELVLRNFENPLFIMTNASEGTVKRRLKSRVDVSDADYNIYLKQKEVFEPPSEVDFFTLNTEKSKEELLSTLKKLIKN